MEDKEHELERLKAEARALVAAMSEEQAAELLSQITR